MFSFFLFSFCLVRKVWMFFSNNYCVDPSAVPLYDSAELQIKVWLLLEVNVDENAE